jgi:cytochrome b involved in lipid metabolism
MKKFVIIFLFLTVSALLTGCFNQSGNQSGNVGKVNQDASRKIVLEEVAQHALEADCWMAINGKVYDVTEFVKTHPGGKAILQGCGKDATQLFETRPMGSGTPHSDNARRISEKYLIGELSN